MQAVKGSFVQAQDRARPEPKQAFRVFDMRANYFERQIELANPVLSFFASNFVGISENRRRVGDAVAIARHELTCAPPRSENRAQRPFPGLFGHFLYGYCRRQSSVAVLEADLASFRFGERAPQVLLGLLPFGLSPNPGTVLRIYQRTHNLLRDECRATLICPRTVSH